MSEATERAHADVSNILQLADLKATITGGHETRRGDWVCDEWRVVFERQHRKNPAQPFERFEFPYYTGTGHRKTPVPVIRMIARTYGVTVRADGSLSNSQPGHAHGGISSRSLSLYRREVERAAKPVAPHAASVLYGLLLDGEACDMPLQDWCDNFGRNSDSIKDVATYNECVQTGHTLHRMFTPHQLASLREALQDY